MIKVNIIKPHPAYELGEIELETERANYLIRVGVAEPVAEYAEKSVKPKFKEKVENKKGNVPTAKKVKK